MSAIGENDHITVTRTDENHFSVRFAEPVSGPGSAVNGDIIPVEWLRTVLDFYVEHRKKDGSLDDSDRQRVEPLW